MTTEERRKRAEASKDWLANKGWVAAHEDALRELVEEWVTCDDSARREVIWFEVNAEMTRYSRIENFSKEVDRS